MATSAQKQPQPNVGQASGSQVNLAAQRAAYEAPKVHIPDNFTEERGKLRAFLAKLKLYIGFNEAKFPDDLRKTLFTTSYLKNAAFNWVDPHLQEYMKLSNDEKKKNNDTIFTSWSHYQLVLQHTFEIIDKK